MLSPNRSTGPRRFAVPCDLSSVQLRAYLDDELDAVGAATFESHLKSCQECAAVLASEKALRQTLASSELYERAPDRLRQNVLSGLPAPVAKSQSWRWVALAAALLLAVLLGRELLTVLRGQSDVTMLASAAVDAHLRSLQPGHLTDVESTDQHTVKPWFDGKVAFAPSVRDFSSDGFPLRGGRLDILAGRTAAALVYGRRKHIINVFVLESQPPIAVSNSGDRHGYRWLSWQKDGFTYVAVSDAAPDDLQRLRELFLKE
jgi:anti-sigma factor RsiW